MEDVEKPTKAPVKKRKARRKGKSFDYTPHITKTKKIVKLFKNDPTALYFGTFMQIHGGMGKQMRYHYTHTTPVPELIALFKEAAGIQEERITASALDSVPGKLLWLRCKAKWVPEEVRLRLAMEKEFLSKDAKITIKIGS